MHLLKFPLKPIYKEYKKSRDKEKEEWYFSVVDVVAVLTDSPNPNNYWKVLKKRLKDEGNQSVTSCNQLKLKSHKDGKRYLTDVATTEQLLRIIQSIPSPKAEPFKLWLAKASMTEISKSENPQTFEENRTVAQKGGEVAGTARRAVEAQTGKSVITSQNAAQLNAVVTGMIEGVVDAEKKKDETAE